MTAPQRAKARPPEVIELGTDVPANATVTHENGQLVVRRPVPLRMAEPAG